MLKFQILMILLSEDKHSKKLCSNKNNKAIEILNKLIISNCNSNLVILKVIFLNGLIK